MIEEKQNNYPETVRPEAEDEINLLDLLLVIARRWRMIVKVTAAAFVLSIGISLLLPNIYTGTARIIPPQEDQGLMAAMMGQIGGLASLAGGALGGGTSADLYVGIMKSEAVKDRIIDRFDLMQVYKQDYRVTTYKALDKRASIIAGKKDGIIVISVDDEDPQRAADMANAFVEELGQVTVDLNIAGAGQNRVFLEKRLAQSRADLTLAEEQLRSFQAANKALDVPEQAKVTIEGVALLRAQLAAQEVQLAGLRSRLTDNTQEVRDLRASIATMRHEVAKLEGAGSSGAIPSFGDLPGIGQEYVRLMREFKIQETLVDLLTKQYEMARLTEAKDVSTLQVLQEARAPDKKSKPKRALIVLMATVVAGFMAVFWAFVYEFGERMGVEDRQRWQEIRGLLRLRGKSE